jgi:hypothetical protein
MGKDCLRRFVIEQKKENENRERQAAAYCRARFCFEWGTGCVKKDRGNHPGAQNSLAALQCLDRLEDFMSSNVYTNQSFHAE